MRLPFVLQAWLHTGLLLLTLLLITVCGTPMEKNQSSEAQPKTPMQETQGDAQVGEEQRPNLEDTFNKENSDMDLCNEWVSYNSDFYTRHLKKLQKELPSCPCNFLIDTLDKVVSLFDHHLGHNYYWRNTMDMDKDGNVNHPSAGQCMRSLREKDSYSVASQLCCYDSDGHLITWGKKAGFPQIISPDISPELHVIVDYVPWKICKGNWSIFHSLLPPNNGLSCPQSPSKDEYEAQLLELSTH